MPELETKRNAASVKAFVDGVGDAKRRKDCRAVMKIMRRASGRPPKMWGKSIVGYGTYRYENASGKPQQWMLTGVSPRKNELTLYIMNGFAKYGPLLKRLGPHRTGKSCLYIKDLDEVDLGALERLVARSLADLARSYEVGP